MANITCVSCNQRKKEENFSNDSLMSNAPTCAGCDVKILMKRIEASKRDLMAISKQQQAVISTAKKIDEKLTNKPSKLSSQSLLKRLLLSETV